MKNLEIQVETNDALQKAEAFNIIDQEQLDAAGSFLVLTKGIKKKINETFKPIVDKAHAAHKEAIAQRDKHLEPLNKAERIIKPKISVYIAECQRKEREEQARIQAEEKKRQEEMALKEAEVADTQDEAEEILQDAIEAPAPIIKAPPQFAKVKGISVKKLVKWEIKDKSKIKPQYFVLDETKIGKIVRTMGKDAESIVGGIRVYTVDSVAARS